MENNGIQTEKFNIDGHAVHPFALGTAKAGCLYMIKLEVVANFSCASIQSGLSSTSGKLQGYIMSIFQILFIFFLSVPILEIYLLLKIGGVIGIFPTVILVVGTAALGAAMLRKQGFSTMQRLQNALSKGEIPAMEMIEGPILLVGGALLLTPGFVTDALGFFCLIPQTRKWFVSYLLEKHMITTGMNAGMQRNQPTGTDGDTIEGEYKKED